MSEGGGDDMGATRSRGAQSHLWGAQIRREVDILLNATEGVGASSLFAALATEAVVADGGQLSTTTGEQGYAWNPKAHGRERDPVQARIRSAGASLGRVLVGGQPDHRSYLAFLEAIYQVTTSQERPVTERIEQLWEAYAAMSEEERVEQEERAARPGLLRRFWRALRAWWLQGLEGLD